MVRVCYMKRLSEQFINSFTELKNNHVFRILIHSLWISHQKWYKSWSVALQRNVYGTRFNIILAYWHIAKCYVPCDDRQLSCYLFYFHFHQMCANKRQNSKSSFATIYLFIIIIIFLISGHNHEIIMILFVASPCTLIKMGTN